MRSIVIVAQIQAAQKIECGQVEGLKKDYQFIFFPSSAVGTVCVIIVVTSTLN